MVRLLRDTRQRLREWLVIQDTNFCRGRVEGLRGQEDGVVSLDAAIAELLRRDEAHRARARRSKKRTVDAEDYSGSKLDKRLQGLLDEVTAIAEIPLVEPLAVVDDLEQPIS